MTKVFGGPGAEDVFVLPSVPSAKGVDLQLNRPCDKGCKSDAVLVERTVLKLANALHVLHAGGVVFTKTDDVGGAGGQPQRLRLTHDSKPIGR